jgi:predicted oxidoreductase
LRLFLLARLQKKKRNKKTRKVKSNQMTKKEIIKELREILKVYHYKSDEQHISKDVVTSLENLLGSLLK